MSSNLARLVAGEVRAEVARQGLTRKEIERRSQVEPRTYGRYFVEGSREVPFAVLARVAKALGLSASELVARAEAREQLGPMTRPYVADTLADSANNRSAPR